MVSRERLILALPQDTRRASTETVHLRDLATETFLIPRQQPVAGFHEVVLETLRSAGISAPGLQPTRLLQIAVYSN